MAWLISGAGVSALVTDEKSLIWWAEEMVKRGATPSVMVIPDESIGAVPRVRTCGEE